MKVIRVFQPGIGLQSFEIQGNTFGDFLDQIQNTVNTSGAVFTCTEQKVRFSTDNIGRQAVLPTKAAGENENYDATFIITKAKPKGGSVEQLKIQLLDLNDRIAANIKMMERVKSYVTTLEQNLHNDTASVNSMISEVEKLIRQTQFTAARTMSSEEEELARMAEELQNQMGGDQGVYEPESDDDDDDFTW